MTPFHPAPGDPDLDRGNSPGTGPAADEGSFKVPVGVSPSGELVPARKAKGEVSYRCPGCGGPLLLRKGEIRSAHFAHKPEAHCAAETALHSGVKHWIAAILRKRLGDRRVAAPKLRVPCCGIGPPMPAGVRSPCRGQAWFPLQDLEFDQVELEATTPEGLRPDVLLLLQGTPALGIEVLVTHAVDAAKAAKASYPWVEVDAMQVVGAPRAWKPCQQSHPWTGLCRACQWAEEVSSVAFSEADDPMECVAELSAALFERHLNRWLASRANRTRPALVWRCPWCRKRNLRLLGRKFCSRSAATCRFPSCSVFPGIRAGHGSSCPWPSRADRCSGSPRIRNAPSGCCSTAPTGPWSSFVRSANGTAWAACPHRGSPAPSRTHDPSGVIRRQPQVRRWQRHLR